MLCFVCLERSDGYDCWADIRLLQPAASQIQDLERFKRCLDVVLDGAGTYGFDSEEDVLPVLREMPVGQQLQLDDWVDILPAVLSGLG